VTPVPEFNWFLIPDDCDTTRSAPSLTSPLSPTDHSPLAEQYRAWIAARAEARANTAKAQQWLASIEALPFVPQWMKQEYRSELRCGGQIVRGWLEEIRITGDGSLSPLYYMCRQGYDSPLYTKTYSVTVDRPAGGPYGQFAVQRNGPERGWWHVKITDEALTAQQRFGLPPQPGPDCVKDCTFFYPAPCERLRSVTWSWQVVPPGRIEPGPKETAP